ncbi:MAG: hypothetical protein GZ091_04180 [Paludibacter sp.]|nr:hypothetical protein [Paludibacter sp.]
MKKFQIQQLIILVILLATFTMSACKTDEISAPPVLTVFVNNDDITAAPSITVSSGTRVEYRFEINASTTIADVKTVITDIKDPAKRVSKEFIVGGQINATTQTVKGVFFPKSNTEIMLVVNDVAGNEATKMFTITIQ